MIVDTITDDIFRSLIVEMKVELDLLLINDPRGVSQRDDGNICLIIIHPTGHNNHGLSESGRFLIFERRGIKTDLFAIERYVEEVLDEVLSKFEIIF